MRRLVLLAASCAATPTSPPTATGTHVTLIATAGDKDDVIVAQVNGRPVWGSCVTVQSTGTTRAEALRQCLDFELLAQTAEARGLAADPGVQDALTTALVERLVEKRFEDRYQKPADLGKLMAKVLDDNARQLHRPEYRASSYIRVAVEPATPTDRDALAHQLADQIAARVRDETGMFGVTLNELGEPFRKPVTDAGFKYETADVTARPAAKLVKPYADALFGIADVGRAAGPVRTEWGWDIVLWTGGSPPMESTRDDLAAEVFPNMRRSFFDVWVREIQKDLAVHVEIVGANLDKLERIDLGSPP